jgi:hypothetical protein
VKNFISILGVCMQNNSYFISSLLGLSLFPSLTWADTKSSNVLSVITLQAEDQQENATSTSAVTKFAHDVMDVILDSIVDNKFL